MSSDYGTLPSDGDPEPDDYDPELAPTLIQGLGSGGSTTAMREAQELFDRHDYMGCVQRLRRVPKGDRSPDEKRLKARAVDIVEEIGQLKDVLRRGVKAREYDGLLPKAQRYVELKPDDEKYARLCAKLEARENNQPSDSAAPSQDAADVPALGSPEVARFLLRYVQVGAFAGAVLGALIGGFWKGEGYFLGGLIGGIGAAANEWLGKKR